MTPVLGRYEVAIKVRDLKAAEPFCRDLLGFEVGSRNEESRPEGRIAIGIVDARR